VRGLPHRTGTRLVREGKTQRRASGLPSDVEFTRPAGSCPRGGFANSDGNL
jgi:hypothetical protein